MKDISVKGSHPREILYVYSLYTSEKENTYLQYTAALAIFYYLTTQKVLNYNPEQLLVYDYKDSRRYMWEDKTFMQDINDLRDMKLLSRSRVKTENYRDINAHQITGIALKSFEDLKPSQQNMDRIEELLSCKNKKCGKIMEVILKDDQPALQCMKCRKEEKPIEGFLYDLKSDFTHNFSPVYL